MSARLQTGSVRFSHMREDDVPSVLRIEQAAYSFPWSGGNFLDSIRCGYLCRVARDDARDIVGYFLMMMALQQAESDQAVLDAALSRYVHHYQAAADGVVPVWKLRHG